MAWVYDRQTGRFLHGGSVAPAWDPETQGILRLGDGDPHPDFRTQRANVPGAAGHDPGLPAGAPVPASPAEIEAYDATTPAGRTARARAVLAARRQGLVGRDEWNALLDYLGIDEQVL